jgi:hypothetical protein
MSAGGMDGIPLRLLDRAAEADPSLCQRVQEGRRSEPVVGVEDMLLMLIGCGHVKHCVDRSTRVARSLLFPRIHLEVQQIVVTRQAPYLVAPLVRFRRDILFDWRATLIRHHRLVKRQMLRRGGMRCKRGVQLGSEGAYVRQWIALCSVLVQRDYSEEAKELLEAVAAKERCDQRMTKRLAPIHLRARQTVDAHEEVHSQESIQLFSSGGSPVVRRNSIRVSCELLHEAARQEALQQLERSAVGQVARLLMAKTRQRQLYVVQVAGPLRFILHWCCLLLLFFLVAAAALCLSPAASAALLFVAVPAVVQRQTERGCDIALLEQREGRGSLLLCEGEWLLRRSCAAASC